MRKLWKGGQVTHRGRHYTVENARLCSCAPVPPPVVVWAFGPRALALAARVGDGLVTTCVSQTGPDQAAFFDFYEREVCPRLGT